MSGDYSLTAVAAKAGVDPRDLADQVDPCGAILDSDIPLEQRMSSEAIQRLVDGRFPIERPQQTYSP